METQEDQLQESGVQDYVNAVEAYKEVMRLQHIKLKNESAVSSEELTGKYRVSYEKLCENIKRAQEEYRVASTKAVRCLAEVLAEMTYMEPTDQGHKHIYRIMVDKAQECGNDPLYNGLITAVTVKLKEDAEK